MSIPTDIRLTSERGTEINGRGDFQTVSGEEYIRQRAGTAVFNLSTDVYGTPLTGEEIEDLRSELEEVLADEEYLEEPVEVTISDISGDTIDMNVTTAHNEVTVSI